MHAQVGVIGGCGFYSFLDDVEVATPYGPPSDPIAVGTLPEGHRGAGRRVAFLPRHGRDHRFPPHKIPYRANPNQSVDCTSGRAQTYYEDGAVHDTNTNPNSPNNRRTTIKTAREAGWE